MATKIYIVTLGCDKNRVDAERMLAQLMDAGYEIVEKIESSDIAIINTCAFIELTTSESIDEIIDAGMHKEIGHPQHIIVTGCLSERYREHVKLQLREVDAVVGLGANGNIVDIVNRVKMGKKVSTWPPKGNLPDHGKRVRTTPFYTSYLKIAEGCDNRCSYCAIPGIRGKYRSCRIDYLVEEATQLAQDGVRELCLIAQDTTNYGMDLYGKYMLPELLRELVKIDGLEWIRLLYCYPQRITKELLEVMAKEKKIVKYLDIPLQHCNGKVLREMHRPGNRRYLEALISKIREKVPGIVIRTTFMLGFPGETTEEFEDLLGFVQNMEFERMGCFLYSQESGTPAGERKDQVDSTIKDLRKRDLLYLQLKIIDKINAAYKSKVLTVIHEGEDKENGVLVGRSTMDAPEVDPKVLYTYDNYIEPGTFLKVKIIDSHFSDLVGEVQEILG